MFPRMLLTLWFCMLAFSLGAPGALADPGVTSSKIKIGGVMDLEGRSRGLGRGMKLGIDQALRGRRVKDRKIEYIAANDSYNPKLTVEQTKKFIDQGIFLMMGNVGTPTAKVALPILAENRVPAVGFFTGAGLLRPGVGDVINYRASYVQEVAAVIKNALKAGLVPSQICAYVQNDAYGMAGVEGIRRALTSVPRTQEIRQALDKIMALEGLNPERNNLGPVGVYTRNTLISKEGYESLKNWERTSGARCRLVVTVGAYSAIGRFAGYARYKGEDWIISAVSFTGADNLKSVLNEYAVKDKVVMTQVVPALDSNLPIVKEARKALGESYGYVSLEGYIVGKMFLAIMENIKGDITRANFLKSVKGHNFDIGGLKLNFNSGNQGSNLVTMTYFKAGKFQVMAPEAWQELLL